MSAPRLFAIAAILLIASIGWFVLGGSIEFRTHDRAASGTEQVAALWGGPQVQRAPTFHGGADVSVAGSDVSADFELEQRRKGLLWYATYLVDYAGEYRVRNAGDEPLKTSMTFTFPSPDGVYDGFHVAVDDVDVPVRYGEGNALASFTVPAGETVSVATGYRTQGQDEWRYEPTIGVGAIEDFSLTMTTDFEEVDFPAGAVSPTDKQRVGSGWELTWDYESLVSGRPIALAMPTPLNPGPVASRISFFAPVSLLFFFAALVLLTTTRAVNVHPVNYAFLAAGFFAFHLLFAYLVDRVDLGLSFGIASVVSVGLCVGYLSLAVKDRRAVAEAAVAQFIFLVLFSFSFFFEGYTGLAITIGAVLTLAYFMLRTARVDWSEVFARSADERSARLLQRSAPQSAPMPSVSSDRV